MSQLANGISKELIGIYVHIPFCQTKCPYCDFNTYARIESLRQKYIEALENEIQLWGRVLGNPPIPTIFFGGGTPSYLPSDDIVSLMRVIGNSFEIQPKAEITLEANPGDLTADKLEAYLSCGVNRLSIGAQSFDNRLLELLGRRHSSNDVKQSVRLAKGSGFDNLSIDLMYGLPYQSLKDWEKTLGEVTQLAPPHVSMYCLTLEDETPMGNWVDTGQIPDPDPDLAADMYMMAEKQMAILGYRHYEISNWAFPGKESIHNLIYWKNQSYLGVGPGAHSYLPFCRFSNLKSPREYISCLTRKGAYPAPENLDVEGLVSMPVVEDAEVIGRGLEMGETMMMGLRLDKGVGEEEFLARFGESFWDVFGDTIHNMIKVGLLDVANRRLKLTARGRLLGNEVFRLFVA